jgi:hypothetical protein
MDDDYLVTAEIDDDGCRHLEFHDANFAGH